MTEKSPAIGIDLGTTYSCVAVYEYGTVEIIANDQGSRITPSYVAFTERERLIGEAAKNQVTLNPENTVFDTKRLIGRRFDEESVQADIKHFPFAVVNDKDRPNIEVEYKDQKMKLTPEEISSMILVRMKETAEAHLGKKVTDAVITVPAYFNNAQREATKNAGEIAGLNVLRIINEPTAAAIAYGLDKKAKGEKNVLIFDLGGGTFDVSILSIDDGVFEVKSTCGDTHLGGEDFDNRLVDYFVQEFNRKSGKDISNDKKALRRLRSACEMAKRTLSSASQTTIEIPALADGIDFSSNITRAKFDDLCLDLFQATLNSVQKAIVDAELEKADIDEIVLVGGSTRIPRVQRLLKDYFEGKELNTAINPDEAVAYGAAVQAAIITGMEPEVLQDLLLLDILPISLGIETVGGVMTTLIPRNSTIPTKQQHPATPDSIHQTNVYVTVYEGERQLTKDNNLLGEFILEGIKRATENYFPIIDVTFEVDVNGILKVSAMDTDTKVQNEIIITKEAGRLTQEQIAEMQKQAELFQQDDQNERNRIEALNELKRYVEHIRATLEQTISRANIAPNEQKQIDNKVGEITNWLSDTPLADRNETEAKRNELKNIWDPIARKIHN